MKDDRPLVYFLRAVREGGRHWPALLAAICCSVGVATLWGANIAALFPLIETTVSGKSIQASQADRVAELRRTIDADTQRLELSPEAVGNLTTVERDALIARREMNRRSLEWSVWVDRRVLSWLPREPFHTLCLVVGFVMCGTVARLVLVMSNSMLVAHVSQSIARDIRTRLFNRALGLDRSTFESIGISGFQAQIVHTTDMLAGGITNFFSGAVTEPLRIASCLLGACFISWRLTLASMVFAPIASYLALGLNRRVRLLSVRILDRSLGFHHVILEVLGSHYTVQANTMEQHEQARFREASREMKSTAMLAAFYNTLASPITELFGMAMLCTGLLASSYLVLTHETTIFGIPLCSSPMTVSSMTVFFGLLIGAADPLRKLSGVVNGINTGMAAAGVVYPILDRASALAEPEDHTPVPHPIERIDVRDVTFSYDNVHPVLKSANLTVLRGERLAVVGPNGSGKSTLVNLLCRFYDPQHGDVLLDGVPVTRMGLADLRSRFAVVAQQAQLFNESIWHNIRYGRWDASDEEIVAAARLARVECFAAAMPKGYQTVVGSCGARLSGGQRQRVALARAFLRDAEILILDEATSQVDAESEALIHDALAEYGRDRTIVFITHRESTLRLATRIVRLEGGGFVPVERVSLQAA